MRQMLIRSYLISGKHTAQTFSVQGEVEGGIIYLGAA